MTRSIPAESDAYFATRPVGSRLSAAASPQSAVVADRAELERRVAELRGRHGTIRRVPRPGAATGSPPRPGSSGSTARTACTTVCATAAAATGWLVERLAP